MPRSDPPPDARPCRDWRGWIILAWVALFGLLYAKMVVAERGGKVRGWGERVGISRGQGRRP